MKKQFTVTNGHGRRSLLYAVVTTQDETFANIYADGSTRVKWASGRVTDITPKGVSSGADSLPILVSAFEDADYAPTVHMAPTAFTDIQDFGLWMKSIGLEITPQTVQ